MQDTGSRLNTLINAIPGFIIFKDGEGNWLEANNFTLECIDIKGTIYKGKKNQELLQNKPYLLNTFLFSECTDEEVWNYKETLKADETIYSNGTEKIYEVIKVPVFNSDGTRNGLLVKGRDITNSKKAEEGLRLASKVFENTSEAFVVTDENNQILTVNKAFTSVTGYEPHEVIGKNPKVLQSGIHGLKFYKKMWSDIVQNGYWKGEIWNKRKNGEIYPELLTISTIKNIAGKITNYISVFSDITQQERIKNDFILTGKIQQELLPVPIENNFFEMKTIFQPSDYVSGDFYDYIWSSDQNRLFGYIIDFMGHGLATAIQTSTLRVLFQQVADENLPLNERLRRVNEQSFKYFTEDTFAAAFCFEFDFNTRLLTYTTGGINYYITGSTNGQIETKECSGMLLGIIEDASYEEGTVPFQSGDYFVFLTDGLYELIQDSLKQDKGDFELTVKQLENLTDSHDCTDDVSAVCLKVK